jgi:hypothetical protein
MNGASWNLSEKEPEWHSSETIYVYCKHSCVVILMEYWKNGEQKEAKKERAREGNK